MNAERPDDLKLMAFADGALDADAAAEVASALAADPALQDRVDVYARSAALLREAFAEPEPGPIPPALVRALRQSVRRDRLRSGFRWALPVAAAVAGFVIGGAQPPRIDALWQGGAAARAREAMHEVAEYHAVFVHETEHLVEVPASRRAHIEAWLGQRVGFPLHVPDLSARGLEFLGARLLAVAGRPVAQLIYTTAHGERVALCVTAQDHAADTGILHQTERGFDLYAQGVARHLFIVAAPAGFPMGRALSAELPGLLRGG
jgi:anti-sigma factor RsiW